MGTRENKERTFRMCSIQVAESGRSRTMSIGDVRKGLLMTSEMGKVMTRKQSFKIGMTVS
jgi:hypothetical protein